MLLLLGPPIVCVCVGGCSLRLGLCEIVLGGAYWAGGEGCGRQHRGPGTQHHVCEGWNTFQLQKLTLSIKADEWSAQKPPQLRSVEQACSLVAQPVFLTVTGVGKG